MNELGTRIILITNADTWQVYLEIYFSIYTLPLWTQWEKPFPNKVLSNGLISFTETSSSYFHDAST